MRRRFYLFSKRLGVEKLSAYLHRGRPMVLAFHGVTSEPPGHLCNHEGKHLYLPLFQAFMEHVAARYTPVSLARIVSWLAGEQGLPDRSVAVTFDDGYRNVLTNAVPVLNRLGIPATVFVVTDFVQHGLMVWTDRVISALAVTSKTRLSIEHRGDILEMPIATAEEKIAADYEIRSLCKTLDDTDRTGFLDELFLQLDVDDLAMKKAWIDHVPLAPNDLKVMSDTGIEVGSHSRSHKILTRCTDGVLERELQESKRWIESATGAPCGQFSYPNGRPGDFSRQTQRFVIAAGYRCAVTTVTKRVSSDQNRFEIPRFTLANNNTTLVEFGAEMSGYPNVLRALKRGLKPAA